MADTIFNRVAESKLITFDLEKLYQIGDRIPIDLSQWLDKGIILREKEFRLKLKQHNWKAYRNQFVAIYCSTDAVLPAWASLLVTTYLQPYAKKVVMGTLVDLETHLFTEEIKKINISSFKDKAVIISLIFKGAINKLVKFLLHISSKNIILKLILALNEKS